MREPNSARLQLRLLGTFDAALDGAPLAGFRSAKVRALLAYLAVEAGRPHRRAALETMLWGDYPQRDAQASLRQALTNLRRLLAPLSCAEGSAGQGAGEQEAGSQAGAVLAIDGQEVEFRPQPGQVWVDVWAFDALLAAARPRHSSTLGEADPAGPLAEAVALYRGPFLASLLLGNSPGFEEWRLLHQEQRHQSALLALERLVRCCLAAGRTGEVKQYARQQLALEPWSEWAHQNLMLALALEGQRGAALQQYEACRRVLAEELNTEPSAETEALARQIRASTWRQVNLEGGRLVGGQPDLQPKPFVARGRELAHLDRCLELALAGRGRVAWVSGEAGSGKTALLARFARRAVEAHRSLVVASGRCSAYAGVGDPLLPFREVLQTLYGEIGAGWADPGRNPDHERRLWALFPPAAEALVEISPDLIGRFVSGEALLSRAERLALPDRSWRTRLAELVERAPTDYTYAGAASAGSTQRGFLFEQVTRLLQALARRQPLILLLDDLHWADNATLSLLFHVGQRLADNAILVVGAYRPGEVAAGSSLPGSTGRPESRAHRVPNSRRSSVGGSRERGSEPGEAWQRHPLGPLVHEFCRTWGDTPIDLDQADGRAFVEAFLDTEPNCLDTAFRETLYRHTGGNPLFTIELLRGMQGGGDLFRDDVGCWAQVPTLRWGRLPARVEAVIAERFDRLPAECQTLLQVASVEGEEFTAEVLARVADLGLPRVIHCLSDTLSKQHHLVRPARLLRREPGGQVLSCYRFAHSLFQRYVYDHLDKVARVHLHRSVAEALVPLRLEGEPAAEPGLQDPTAPARLARHWEAAGCFDRAATCLLWAGRRAAQLSAYEEAVHLLRRALALLEHMTEGVERAQLEKQILLDLTRPLMPAQGWASAERAQLARDILDLVRQQPASEGDLIGALYLQAEMLTVHGKHSEALDLIQRLLELARRTEHPAYIALGQFMVAQHHFYAGERAASIPGFQQALAHYSQRQHAHLLPWTDGDLGVRCLSLLAMALGYGGYCDQGRSCSRQALARAEELAHPLTEAIALMFAGCAFHALRLEPEATQEHACRLIEISGRKHLPILRSCGLIFQGWAQALGGAGDPAIHQIRTGLAEWRATGHRTGTPFLLALLAHALQHSGTLDKALSSVEEGLTLATELGATHGAELYRLKGELLCRRPAQTHSSQLSAPDQPEECFRTAVTLARRYGARLLELRATTSLARLWAGPGRRAEAYQALAEIYGGFTEGFDTPDLRAAKALLDTV